MCNTDNVQLPHELVHGHDGRTKQPRVSIPKEIARQGNQRQGGAHPQQLAGHNAGIDAEPEELEEPEEICCWDSQHGKDLYRGRLKEVHLAELQQDGVGVSRCGQLEVFDGSLRHAPLEVEAVRIQRLVPARLLVLEDHYSCARSPLPASTAAI